MRARSKRSKSCLAEFLSTALHHSFVTVEGAALASLDRGVMSIVPFDPLQYRPYCICLCNNDTSGDRIAGSRDPWRKNASYHAQFQ
jgi:hypothetical protein